MPTWAKGQTRTNRQACVGFGLGIGHCLLPLSPPQKKPGLAALPLLAAPLSGPGWLLAVQRSLVPGQVRMEFFQAGTGGLVGEQMLRSPDAPFGPWGPQSPLATGQGFWSYHLDVGFTPLGQPWG